MLKLQPTKNQYSQLYFTGFCVVVGLIAILLFVLNQQQERVVVVFKEHSCLLEGSSFELKWIHSVEKQQWIEIYELQEGMLWLTDTYFETFGAGTPSMSVSSSVNEKTTSQHQRVTERVRRDYLNHKYRGYIHYQVNQKLPYLNWMVSSNIKASIINQNETLPVYQWASDYTNIYIAPKRLTLWAQLLQESCHDDTKLSTARIDN